MNTPLTKFEAAMSDLPLVAILRGFTPADAPAIGDVLIEAGFRLLEVPLNSPRPLASIALLRKRSPQGAGRGGHCAPRPGVHEVVAAGGELIVAPNFNPEVIAETTRLRRPGRGRHRPQAVPAEFASPFVIKALLAVLPPATKLMPVGGISVGNIPARRPAGAAGFGLGSALFRPGDDGPTVRRKTSALVAAYRAGA